MNLGLTYATPFTYEKLYIFCLIVIFSFHLYQLVLKHNNPKFIASCVL
jgi:hypothetical protein